MTALKLPSIFTDHMVLQRDAALPIWGWATPATKVSATIAGQSASTVADSAGKWKLSLKPLSAGGPHELVVSNGAETLRRTDVLIGDVWLCSGQSNMEWGVISSNDGEQEVANANHPRIRLIHLPRVTATEPAADFDAIWKICSPASIPAFSAVGYFFGREIQKQLDVPIGLINSSWGGTPAEAWTPLGDLKADPSLAYYADALSVPPGATPPGPHEDTGNKGVDMGWANAHFDDANWPTMHIPQPWHSTGLNIDGSVWFRRTVNLPADFAGKPILLNLGVANDFDVTYFNGQQVGGIGKETANWWTIPRKYPIDGSLVKAGLNTIAVRVFDQWAEGGLLGPARLMKIHPVGDESRAIDLTGDWKYQVETALPHILPSNNGVLPTTLYNSMIAPLVPFSMRGVIWYQGESNAKRAVQYRTLFPTMIKSWRREWGQGDFPFLFVQLANFEDRSDTPAGSPWAELREAQTETLSLPNTGQAITIDIGDPVDIHPRNKLDVGLRLAHEAMRLSYGKEAPRSPMYQSMKIDGQKAIVTFQFAPDGLIAKDGEPSSFVIAGEDHKFHPAVAKVDGSTVIVSSAAVSKPVAVRYGWADTPVCNLYSKAGLPACPFRTDDWPAATEGAK